MSLIPSGNREGSSKELENLKGTAYPTTYRSTYHTKTSRVSELSQFGSTLSTSEMATNGTHHSPKPAAARLRELLQRPDSIVACPGVYDGISARIALREGFDCLYMTGAGTAASVLGMPDLGIIQLNDILGNAAMIASLDRRVPVIADADTGYGG